MSDLNQQLLNKQQVNKMTFDQLSQKVTQQLNSVTQKNQQLMKKSESDHDPQFLKNFHHFKKQIHDEITVTQETIKILMNKAKTVVEKNTGKRFNEQILQEFERYKNSVKKIMNSSFQQKQDFLRKSSVMNNSRSLESDGGTIDQSGRTETNRGLYQQQQQSQQQRQQDQAFQKQQWDQLDLEQQLNEERQQEFNEFEKEVIQINDNFNKIGQLIVDQGVQLDVIEDTHFQAHEQVIGAQREMREANETQKSAKRKYIIFALIILIALGITLAVVFTQM